MEVLGSMSMSLSLCYFDLKHRAIGLDSYVVETLKEA